MRAILYASMNQEPLTRASAAKALSDVFAPSESNLTMADILRVTAKHFSLDAEDLRSKGRRQELVVARQAAMYLIREMTSHSYPEIGQFFGGRDHSTVMYAVQKMAEQVAHDDDLTRRIRQIQETLV